MTDWETRMSERAATRRPPLELSEPPEELPERPDRSTWPVPDELKGYSARDVFLWYVSQGWVQLFGGEVRTEFYHDFGYHVLRNGDWQLTFANLSEYPDQQFGLENAESAPAGEGEGAQRSHRGH